MTEILTEFDVIVIGGGINGLTAAAYLSKAGLGTVVIERRDQLGTHAVTEEWIMPGFRLTPHATAILTGFTPPMADLELDRFGLQLAIPREGRAMTFRDGKAFVPIAWNANDSYRKWLKFSEKDAKVFKDLANAVGPIILGLFMNFVNAAPTPERWDWAIEEIAKLPHIPSDWWDMTGFELADLLFEDEHIKAYVTSWASGIEYSPQEKLIGPLGVVLLTSFSGIGQAIGGAHQITHALARCIIRHGGKILQSCEVEKVMIEDGEAKGVLLGKHSAYPEKKILARKAIISDLSPVPTFLHLIGEDHLDRGTARVLRLFNYEGALFTTCCLTTSLPKWKGTGFDQDMSNAWTFNVGVESMEEVEKTVMQINSGRIPEPINALGVDFVITIHDKTAAPPGYHYVQFWSDVPYNLRKLGGPEKWDDITDEIVDRVIAMADEYAPGFSQTVKHKLGISPLDLYRKNPSAVKGHQNGGVQKSGQLYFDRPFLGCNAPRTPFKKLYLCNGTWPIGDTSLASAYIAACEVLADLGMERPSWWSHKQFDWFHDWAARNNISLEFTVTA